MITSRGKSHFVFGRQAWMAVMVVLVMTACFLTHGNALAQVGPDNPAVQSVTRPTTLGDYFLFSPVINSIIIALSVVAVVMFVYFLLTINTRTFAPPSFIDDVTKLAVAKQYEQAAHLCRNNRAIFTASILQRCFENAKRDAGHLMNIIENEGQRRAGLVWNRISYLIDISVVAPMLGLLGTVLGMLRAFFDITSGESPSVHSRRLAESIGSAMTVTFLGLVVAILAVVFHAIIKSRAVRALSESEQVVHSIADYIKRGDA